jgi:hypothetical protein
MDVSAIGKVEPRLLLFPGVHHPAGAPDLSGFPGNPGQRAAVGKISFLLPNRSIVSLDTSFIFVFNIFHVATGQVILLAYRKIKVKLLIEDLLW